MKNMNKEVIEILLNSSIGKQMIELNLNPFTELNEFEKRMKGLKIEPKHRILYRANKALFMDIYLTLKNEICNGKLYIEEVKLD